MPELPEVETVARDLRREILNHAVRSVTTSGKKLRRSVDRAGLGRLIDLELRRVDRRGKYLLLRFAPPGTELGAAPAAAEQVLIGHLGMSGRLVVSEPGAPLLPHTHLRLGLDGDQGARELRYTDPRRFGLWRTYAGPELCSAPELAALGPDPLEPAFDVDYLHASLRRTQRPLKLALLDQGLVAGLGNIYVCEALFRAGLSPFARGVRTTRPQAARLHQAIVEVIGRALENRGTSFSDYVDGRGEAGQNQHALFVFQREQEHCRRCQTPIRRRVQSGRSTFYCPRCQVR